MATPMLLDIADRAACRQVAATIARDENISILVNDAGINRRNHITGDAVAVDQDWDDILSINLDGMFNVTHAFLDRCARAKADRQRRIHPVVCACELAELGCLYDVETWRIGFHARSRGQLGKDGVRVNAIGPGLIETKIDAEARAKIRTWPCRSAYGVERAGKPEDIAGPADLLASDLSAYVTGCIIMADGGFRTVLLSPSRPSPPPPSSPPPPPPPPPPSSPPLFPLSPPSPSFPPSFFPVSHPPPSSPSSLLLLPPPPSPSPLLSPPSPPPPPPPLCIPIPPSHFTTPPLPSPSSHSPSPLFSPPFLAPSLLHPLPNDTSPSPSPPLFLLPF